MSELNKGRKTSLEIKIRLKYWNEKIIILRKRMESIISKQTCGKCKAKLKIQQKQRWQLQQPFQSKPTNSFLEANEIYKGTFWSKLYENRLQCWHILYTTHFEYLLSSHYKSMNHVYNEHIMYIPSTRSCFDVDKTLFGLQQRFCNVETTLCAFWDEKISYPHLRLFSQATLLKEIITILKVWKFL